MQQNGDATAELVSKLTRDEETKNLVVGFFIVFSRFEYAMKRSRFLKDKTQSKDKRAEPDWDKLANKISSKFSSAASSELSELNEAILYLKTHPPQQQVIDNNTLSWVGLTQGSGEKICRWILRTIQTVRNNLFHGGKFPIPIGPIAGTERDKVLLKSSIVVLFYISELDQNLKGFFYEP